MGVVCTQDITYQNQHESLPQGRPSFMLTYLFMSLNCPVRVVDSLVNSRFLGAWFLFQTAIKLFDVELSLHLLEPDRTTGDGSYECSLPLTNLELSASIEIVPAKSRRQLFSFSAWTWFPHGMTTCNSEKREWCSPGGVSETNLTVTEMAAKIGAFFDRLNL